MKQPGSKINDNDKSGATSTLEPTASAIKRYGNRHGTPDNENIRALPNHLRQFIVDQNYEQYTPIDHAVWRYVMRQNYHFLREYAHFIYFQGLDKTGIGVERVPSIYEMNDILARIGWAAVTVDGFIPPAAFMEFQAYKVLVIAANVRQIHHIEYTPAPDILHEAAGHAPIIADEEYANYLQHVGAVGAKAMSSKKDFELYEAIRHLSILKEAPHSDIEEIKSAEQDVAYKQANLGEPSEMALLSRLHWWTVEYGLIGTVDRPKIYGAGLLSSIGESANCMTDAVKKLPYTLDAVNYAFDITTQQPQLFVTQSFQHLTDVLVEFASTMSFRTGGITGINKAIECKSVCTCEYSSGLQVSGVFTEVLCDESNRPAYLRTTGPTALAYDYKQLQGHGKDYHKEGFGSPIGKLKNFSKPLELATDGDLHQLRIEVGKSSDLHFESGIRVHGAVEHVIRNAGKVVLITFSGCKIVLGGTTLFEPTWGAFDMAVGATIVSVFSGAADKDAFDQVALVPRERTIVVTHDANTLKLNQLYQKVRDCRENKKGYEVLPDVWKQVCAEHPDDWLLGLEILEILTREEIKPKLADEIRVSLNARKSKDHVLTKMIDDGIALLGE